MSSEREDINPIIKSSIELETTKNTSSMEISGANYPAETTLINRNASDLEKLLCKFITERRGVIYPIEEAMAHGHSHVVKQMIDFIMLGSFDEYDKSMHSLLYKVYILEKAQPITIADLDIHLQNFSKINLSETKEEKFIYVLYKLYIKLQNLDFLNLINELNLKCIELFNDSFLNNISMTLILIQTLNKLCTSHDKINLLPVKIEGSHAIAYLKYLISLNICSDYTSKYYTKIILYSNFSPLMSPTLTKMKLQNNN